MSDRALASRTGVTSAAALPTELLNQLLSSTKNLPAILNSRIASSCAKDPAADLITTLTARGGLLPKKAWQVFKDAKKLDCTNYVKHANGELSSGFSYNSIAYFQHVVDLLATLPDRVQDINISTSYGAPELNRWDRIQSAHFSVALLLSACSCTLRKLEIAQWITQHAANLILKCVPQLEQLKLAICNDTSDSTDAAPGVALPSPTWCPLPPTSTKLSSLHITCHDPITIDLSPLATTTTLTSLQLHADSFANTAAISSLKALQTLHLQERSAQPSTPLDPGLSFLRGLDELHTLELPNTMCNSDAWSVLITLPKLDCFIHNGLVVSEAATTTAASTSITCLSPDIESYATVELADVPDEQLLGCLARMLPNLRNMVTGAFDLPELLAALRGHSQLQHLYITQLSDEAAVADRWHVSSMFALERVTFDYFRGDVDELLVGLAGCPALKEINIYVSGGFVRQQQEEEQRGLGALARGGCSKTLRSVNIGWWWFTIREVAALLRGGMAALQQVEVTVEVPGGWEGEEEVQRGLLAALQQEGAAVGVEVWCRNSKVQPLERGSSVDWDGTKPASCSLKVLQGAGDGSGGSEV